MRSILNYIYIFIGIISFILGAIGVVLPVLPTTPFLLLSAYLFAKSSEKFHRWLLSTKLYKNHIDAMMNKKQMTLKAKIKTLGFFTIVFIVGIIFAPIWHVKAFIAIIAVGHYFYFIFKIETIEEPVNKLRS